MRYVAYLSKIYVAIELTQLSCEQPWYLTEYTEQIQHLMNSMLRRIGAVIQGEW